MKARRKLTDFMPLYSDAKTGSIVIDEPAGDETPTTTTAELDKLAGDEMTITVLPELRGGELLLNPRSGKKYRVHKVANKGEHATAHDEPLYRLENVVIGNRRWTLDDLVLAGLKLEEA